MGCGGSKAVTYEHGNKVRTIPPQEAKTIQRWTYGAQARFKTLIMKRRLLKAITDVRKPTIVNGVIVA